ncbi:MAG: LysM peptidoglycan-binding domain-containing protein [Crocinitomicaceae bacterium]
MMKNILSVFLLFFSLLAFSQPEDAVVKTIEGEKFYVHTVVEGNTLYGIHKLYNTELEKILAANPGLNDNLIVGQQVLIPIDKSNASFYGSHTVEQGETLYGISKKYNCTVSDLKKLNPGVENGLHIGQILKIPKEQKGEVIQTDPVIEKKIPDFNISFSDSIVIHEVLAHETLYSIAKRYMVSQDTIMKLNEMRNTKVKKGDLLHVPVKQVNYKVLHKEVEPIQKDSSTLLGYSERKEVYKVALLLPFMLDRNDSEMSKPIKFGQTRELFPTTEIALGFYQGFMLAADSLKKAGMSLEIFIYDTKKDTAVIASIFEKEEFQEIDLLIGPFFQNCISYTAAKCAERKIRMVSPFKTDPKTLHNNPFAFKPVTSNMSLMEGTIDYIVKHHAHHNIVILKPFSEGDKALFESAVQRFNAAIDTLDEVYNTEIVQLSLGSSSGRDLNAQLKKDTVNIVIVPSNDVKFVSGAMNRLNQVMNFNPYAKKMRVIAFGFEDWNKHDDIDVLHRNRLNQHYSTYRFVDYNTDNGLKLVRAFRKQNGVDPTVYSTQGFDIGFYFLSALHKYGTNFETFLKHHQLELVQNDFYFQQIAPGSGFENKSVSIVRYENFELIACPQE